MHTLMFYRLTNATASPIAHTEVLECNEYGHLHNSYTIIRTPRWRSIKFVNSLPQWNCCI